MSGTGRHVLSRPRHVTSGEWAEQWCARVRLPTRLGVTTVVAVLVTVAVMILAVVAASTRSTGGSVPVVQANAGPAVSELGRQGLTSSGSVARRAGVPLVLTSADHQDCPATATACVDLARRITWLQAQGKTTFGPVQIEPGKPHSGHPTPRGTFRVSWKAGPAFQSNLYHEAMPWATFFAPGGIAFHGGSLIAWSHGCVHLTNGNAHYYNEHLAIGATVVVF